jgi:hypothetical protein
MDFFNESLNASFQEGRGSLQDTLRPRISKMYNVILSVKKSHKFKPYSREWGNRFNFEREE